MSAENFAVALTKTQCPACGEIADGPIVLNKLLTAKAAKEVKELQGKVIELELCSRCKAVVEQQGGTLLVEIDPAKSTVVDGKIKFENAWRTGRVWGIKKEAALRLLGVDQPLVYIEPELAETLGLAEMKPTEEPVEAPAEAPAE